MTPPRISIIVPTFNAEKVIGQCLQSLVSQTLPPLEVCVMDGRSTDRTVHIAEAFARRHAFVHVASEADTGMYDGMNRGIARAQGDWLYFIGADDALVDAQVLARFASLLEPGDELVYGNIVRMTTDTVEGGPVDDAQLIDKTICHQAMFFRRELFQRLGHFNLVYPVCADWDFNLRCFGEPCVRRYIDLTVCKYAGTGFSSKTVDTAFITQKLPAVSQAYGVSYWNRLFRGNRHDFYFAARREWAQKHFLRGLQFFAVYVFHGLAAGDAASKLLRRAWPHAQRRSRSRGP